MGRIYCRYSVTALMALLFVTALTGQVPSPFHPALRSEAYLVSEHLEVFADRSIYIPGEYVQFRADRFLEGVSPDEGWSSVLYAELVTTSGIPVARGKYSLNEGIATGSLHIPSGTLTGSYFLKCYTRWMRNAGPLSYAYYPLKIVNPVNAQVADPGNGNGEPAAGGRSRYATGILEFEVSGAPYGRGEEVRCLLSPGLYGITEQFECCVTVVPLNGIDTLLGQWNFEGDPVIPAAFRVSYLPDLNGVSLSGTVMSAAQEGHPVPGTKLYFSLLGDRPDYFTAISGTDGRFTLSIPDRRGVQEMFVTPDPAAGNGLEINIDQDFDGDALHPGGGPFTLSGDEHEVATRMALMAQLAIAYHPPPGDTDTATPPAYTRNVPFYGTPMKTLLLDDYVELPSLEEVFINLIPEVEVVSRRGESSLRIVGPNPSLQLFRPLILVDLIPVFDQQTILRIAPEKVLKVEVINEIYIKGDVFHGGVISIISRNGDMAGVDLPEGSYFFDFLSLQTADVRGETLFSEADRVPDLRNTVLWLDRVRIGNGETREITFPSPSNPGEYVILVRGVNPGGGVIAASRRFRVQ